MKLSRQELKKLTLVLQKAYREKESLHVGEEWQSSVMLRIRHLGPPEPVQSYLPTFEHLVWRIAPVTSLLMVGLTGLSLAMNGLFEYDLYQLFLNTVEDSALLHLLGM